VILSLSDLAFLHIGNSFSLGSTFGQCRQTVVSVSVEVEPLAPQQGLVAAVSAMSFGVMREGMIDFIRTRKRATKRYKLSRSGFKVKIATRSLIGCVRHDFAGTSIRSWQKNQSIAPIL
jgi:hypothetical protein